MSGEDVALVGESYNPRRAGWSDGAYKSSINVLNALYRFTLDGAMATGTRSRARFGRFATPTTIGSDE